MSTNLKIIKNKHTHLFVQLYKKNQPRTFKKMDGLLF